MVPGGGAMTDGIFGFLLDGANWSLGAGDGFPQRTLEHLGYTVLAVGIAFVLAFPVGVLIGHTGKAAFLAINAGNAGRAVPTLGALLLVVSLAGDRPDCRPPWRSPSWPSRRSSPRRTPG